MTAYPCGSGKVLDACCGSLIAGAPAPTAEALMRSRYTAYATSNIAYVAATHAPETAADFNKAGSQ